MKNKKDKVRPLCLDPSLTQGWIAGERSNHSKRAFSQTPEEEATAVSGNQSMQ